MGINNFIKWIEKIHPTTIVNKNRFEHIYIDLNIIMHRVSIGVPNETELLNRIINSIKSILGWVKPTKSVTFAADGIAPFAKMELQRKRRLNHALKYNKANYNNSTLSPLIFTPGTYWMESLDFHLREYFTKINNDRNINVHVNIKGGGEAELKLINQLQKNGQIIEYANDSHCIFSSDSDIYLIAAMSCVPNIYINNNKIVYSISDLIQSIKQKLHFSEVNSGINMISKDFGLLSLFLGNDYLPKLGYITFEDLINAYIKLSQVYDLHLVSNDNTLNKDAMVYFLRFITIDLKESGMGRLVLEDDVNVDYSNYITGVIWCYNQYLYAKCDKLDYLCKSTTVINPFGLLLWFEKDMYNINVINDALKSNDEYNIIDNDIYGTIIMPEVGVKFINYNRRMEYTDEDKIKVENLYELERCATCRDYRNQIREINKIYEQTTNSDDKTKLKKKITTINKNYHEHNINHKPLCLDQILELVKILKRSQREFIKKEPIKLELNNTPKQLNKFSINKQYMF